MMKYWITYTLILFSIVCYAQNTLLSNVDVLSSNKKILNKSVRGENALASLKREGKIILAKSLVSVVEKNELPPSKNKHDYYSLATYYWSNPLTKTGFPYIHRDGKKNPAINEVTDNKYLFNLCKDIRTLGVLYFYTEDEAYAKKGREMIQHWFINTNTRMNPNLEYAQVIKGNSTGRSVGIVDTRELIDLLDGVQLLRASNIWTNEDVKTINMWFTDYLNWLLTSTKGKEASTLKNNIGTSYLAQTVGISIFLNKKDQAKSLLSKTVPNLLSYQFAKDGSQPLEMKRNDPWMYSNSNLNQWLNLLLMANVVDFDLFNYEYAGRSLNQSYEFLRKYADGEKKWNKKLTMGKNLEESFNRNRMKVKTQSKARSMNSVNSINNINQENNSLNLLVDSYL